MPETLYNFICRDENVKTLNKIKLKFPHAIEIVKLFIEDESIGTQEQQFNTLKDYLIKNAKIYQFIFGNLFPRCFARIDDYGIQSKTTFNFHYKNYLAQKSVFEWQQKNSILSSLNNENTTANLTPLNMTKLNDDNDDNDDKKDIEITDIKDEIKDDIHIINVEVVEHNKKNIDRKRLRKKNKIK